MKAKFDQKEFATDTGRRTADTGPPRPVTRDSFLKHVLQRSLHDPRLPGAGDFAEVRAVQR